MAIFKCKMCGGTIEFQDGATVGVCDSCGTKQTLPRLDSDRKTNLYDRANHFRRNNEFDKAMSIYENILNEDPTDAEAYWSLVLCRYGIEYVEDPATHRRLPTVNRAQFTSIFDDEDYKSAMQNADALQRAIYEDEARAINEIQKGILEISSKEEPFDVFICYKETDANGRRTPDSVLATDLYHQLTNEGFKVFFSRITLEDKLGQEYEPYIFAALNSAKAMVVLGTKPEHFNAVWVKNEWSRYLALIKAGAKKTLIPAYRDMDPYDLPDEFSHLQAQDMGKLGFMQDLIRGIKKIVKTDEPKQTIRETIVTPAPTAATAPLLRRAFMFLEDGEWSSANEYCEKVLDAEPENAEAYLGKLMAELRVKNRDDLKNQPQAFDDRNNYKKAVRFGDDALKKKLTDDVAFINDRNETARKEGIYQDALAEMKKNTKRGYHSAILQFGSIIGYRDAQEKIRKCEEAQKDIVYESAEKAAKLDSIVHLEAAVGFWKSIPEWRDADKRIIEAQRRIEQLKKQENRLQEEANKRNKKTKKAALMIAAAAAVIFTVLIVLFVIIIPKAKLNRAKELLDSCDYQAAYTLLEEIGRDDLIASNKHERAIALINQGNRDEGYALLREIGDMDSIHAFQYDAAKTLYENKQYESAIDIFSSLGDYLDCRDMILACQYEKAIDLKNEGKYAEAIALFIKLGSYYDCAAQIDMCRTGILELEYTEAIELLNQRRCAEAWQAFDALGTFKDSVAKKADCLSFARGQVIATGLYHSVAVKSDGTVIVTEFTGAKHEKSSLTSTTLEYDVGQCDIEGWNNIISVDACAYYTVGLSIDGTVHMTKYTGHHIKPINSINVEEWSNITAISTSYDHVLGLKTDGTVVASGSNYYGQCNVSEWHDIVAIAAGASYSIGLKSDGTVVATGVSVTNACEVSDWSDIIDVKAGGSFTIGLKSNGTVVITPIQGSDFAEEFGSITEWSNIIAISATDRSIMGLKSDGTVVAAGKEIPNSLGQSAVADWKDIVAIDVSTFHAIGLKKDGTLIATKFTASKDYYHGQCDVSDWKNIKVPD